MVYMFAGVTIVTKLQWSANNLLLYIYMLYIVGYDHQTDDSDANISQSAIMFAKGHSRFLDA